MIDITVEITQPIIVEVATPDIVLNFDTVQTRDIAFGYDSFDGDGATKEFILSSQYKENSCIVFVNGVLAKKGIGGTYTEGLTRNSVVFVNAPAGGGYKDEIVVFYAKA